MKEIKRLTRCEKGHFYDAGKYDVCPHCENTMEIAVTRYEQDRSTSIFIDDAVAPEKTPRREQPPAQDYFVGSIDSEPDSSTIHFYQKTLGTEPVVGWLVCVSGVHCGQDFRIKSGRNFVGRSGAMDVCLSGDMGVSRDRHLIVTYDPKGTLFFVQPGDTSSALSYLNDKPLLEATELHQGDRLTVGESELMFVPFCGSIFTWKN